MTRRGSLATLTAALAFAACGVQAIPGPMDLGRYEAALVRHMNGRYSGTVSAIDGGGICEHAGGTYSLDMVSRSPFRCVYEDLDASCDHAQHAFIDVVEGQLAVAGAPAIDARGSLRLDVKVGADERDVAMARFELYVGGAQVLRHHPGVFHPDDGPSGFWASVGGICNLAIAEFTAAE